MNEKELYNIIIKLSETGSQIRQVQDAINALDCSEHIGRGEFLSFALGGLKAQEKALRLQVANCKNIAAIANPSR
jgi:hypothetical protein